MFGIIGIILGVVALRQGDPLGRCAIIASVGGLVVGMLIGAIIFAADDDDAMALLLGAG